MVWQSTLRVVPEMNVIPRYLNVFTHSIEELPNFIAETFIGTDPQWQHNDFWGLNITECITPNQNKHQA